jgi:putative ABC transport system substrate-binding protein
MKANKILRAIFALLITAGVLLLLDLENRKSAIKATDLKKIAIFKMASRPTLDEAENGILEALAQRGFTDGKNCTIKRFCAEGDMPTANTIAQNIVSSKYNMVITISTPALQVMANANKSGEVLHVFCAVTDPYASGVGITGSATSEHPKHLVGIGTFQPVEKAFDIAKQMNPNLKKVGTVWCTSETCSEACVKLARRKCAELGIELVEMSVESTTQVLETAMSLTSRGVEALWLGGDNVVEAGIDQLVTAANKAQIPLFTNNPYNIRGNTLFGVGAEYIEVGRTAGNMAADVLNGKPTSEISIGNVVPIKLSVNPDGIKNLKGKWDTGLVNQ